MEKFKKYKIVTYGCQMNIHESEKIAGVLEDLGYKATDSDELARSSAFSLIQQVLKTITSASVSPFAKE